MKGYVFHSTSLLLIYDEKSEEKSEDSYEILVKLIDFAHVQFIEKQDEIDDSFVRAIRNIQCYLISLYDLRNLIVNLNF